MSEIECQNCGEKNWTDDNRFGGLKCRSCGWNPRKKREDALKELLASSGQE